MRLSVHHTERILFDQPGPGLIAVLRVTPRDHTGHYVCDWSVDVDADCKIETAKDAFGNIVTSFSLPAQVDGVTVTAAGEVETEETHGIVRGTREPIPHGVFLRANHGEAMSALSRTLINAAGAATDGAMHRAEPLPKMHALMATLHAAMPKTDDSTQTRSAQGHQQAQQQAQQADASQAQQADASQVQEAAETHDSLVERRLATLVSERGAPTRHDLAVILCDASRRLGLPARMVSGYALSEEPSAPTDAPDLWTETWIDGLGWIGFDPIRNLCPSETAVRLAVGIDIHAVAPVRAAPYGGAPGALNRETAIAVRRVGG